MEKDLVLPTDPKQIGRMVVAIEMLHQEVLLLQSVVHGFAVSATPEQLRAVASLLDHSVSRYKPMASSYPETNDDNRQSFERLAAGFKEIFSEELK